ncbi:MAG: universal stress protein [Solirubrobacteraceae bacterium]
MSEKIVVGTDGSETAKQAVTEAVRLAKAFDAELHVVTAFKAMRGASIPSAPAGAAKIWAPLPDDAARSIVEQAGAQVRVAGVKGGTRLVEKDPADALLEVAADIGATLIVVGNQGMAGPKRLLGSVPTKVSHEARCNVLIVSTHR